MENVETAKRNKQWKKYQGKIKKRRSESPLLGLLPLRRNKKSTKTNPPPIDAYKHLVHTQTKMIAGDGTKPSDHGSKAVLMCTIVPMFPVVILVLVGLPCKSWSHHSAFFYAFFLLFFF